MRARILVPQKVRDHSYHMDPTPSKTTKITPSGLSRMSKGKRVKLGIPWVENKPAPARSGTSRRKARRDTAIPRLTFRRLVEYIASRCKSDLRIQTDAVEALQQAAEGFLAHRFTRCARLAAMCKIDTVRGEHWRFVGDNNETAAVPC